jgi:hypothetical protein
MLVSFVILIVTVLVIGRILKSQSIDTRGIAVLAPGVGLLEHFFLLPFEVDGVRESQTGVAADEVSLD